MRNCIYTKLIDMIKGFDLIFDFFGFFDFFCFLIIALNLELGVDH